MGHGLGQIPELILLKRRDSTSNWLVHALPVTPTVEDVLQLNTTSAVIDAGSNQWGTALPTSSVFGVVSENLVINNATYVAYCFASKPGFSKFGTYTGNGNASGPFIFTGFKPAFVITKRYSTIGRWTIEDNKRDPFNEVVNGLYANANNADSLGGGGYWDMDFLSNGFKIRATDGEINGNGADFLYIAFAESPFKTANAR